MKLYAVSGGEYSDYRVYAIYKDKDVAERVRGEMLSQIKSRWKANAWNWDDGWDKTEVFVEEFAYQEGYELPLSFDPDNA